MSAGALILSLIINTLILKNIFNRIRPYDVIDGLTLLIERQHDFSFPSGHTANAFLGAYVAWKEFKDTNPYLAYSGYALATFVACSRVYNNRHWVADVVAGAGFGILSVELAYLTYFPIRNAIARKVNMKWSEQLYVTPTFNQHGGGIYLSWRF